MNLTIEQCALFDFVKIQHEGQVRKYSGEPYHVHLWEVAVLIAENVTQHDPYAHLIEIALCHDLFEDTKCQEQELIDFLLSIGYSRQSILKVVRGVNDLTDKFDSKNYQGVNRRSRKQMESDRLASLPYDSITVKYADLINNTSSIVEKDPGFARVYLKEKEEILAKCNKGHRGLYWLAIRSLLDGMDKLQPKPLTQQQYKDQEKKWGEVVEIVSMSDGAVWPITKLRHRFKLSYW